MAISSKPTSGPGGCQRGVFCGHVQVNECHGDRTPSDGSASRRLNKLAVGLATPRRIVSDSYLRLKVANSVQQPMISPSKILVKESQRHIHC